MKVEDVGPVLAVLHAEAKNHRERFDYAKDALITHLPHIRPLFESGDSYDKTRTEDIRQWVRVLHESYLSLALTLTHIGKVERLVTDAAREGKAELSAPE
jgi:hypothetical protein